ncbi:MAG: PDZ domain-containing protein [Clostridia bacterium]|nr:PDZ domain-containing protein [Clostridia bacterium]
MSKKISLGLAISLIFLAIALTITVTMLVAMGIYNDIIKDVSARSGVYSNISEIDELIRKNYYGEINENLLNTMMSDGYVSGIGDRYSYYMTPDEYAKHKEEEKGNKVGIGVIAVYDSKNNNIYVSEVSSGSPAHIQGIQKGDVITAVDGVKVTSSNYAELLQSLEGAKLTNVQVTFVNNGTEKTVSVARGYSAQTVYYSVMNEVGYIKINAFYSTTAKELEDALDYMKKNDVVSVIFDVRNNDTGLIRNVVECIDLIVPVATDGTNAVATAVDKNGNIIETFASDSDSVNFTIIVLVNSNTSGAAELFACDLRDFGLARLVGVKTAGNGTMQKVFELNDGSAVALTVAKILPYKSDSYNDVGLEPDFVVELSAEQNSRLEMITFEEDLQYQKAMDILTNK